MSYMTSLSRIGVDASRSTTRATSGSGTTTFRPCSSTHGPATLSTVSTNIFRTQRCVHRRIKWWTGAVIMLSHNISHPPRRVGHAGQASESRRQLVLAVALGARSAWSMASGGGCVAGRARVDHGCVRARVVGKRKPSLAAAWRYGRCLERAARHHRGARDDEPGPSKGAGGAEDSGSSRRR
jgi:hypothetical protein